MDITKIQDIPKTPEVGGYKEIRPESGTDFQTSRAFWDTVFGAETSADAPFSVEANKEGEIKRNDESVEIPSPWIEEIPEEDRPMEPIDAKDLPGFEDHLPEISTAAEKDTAANGEKNEQSQNEKHCPIEGHGGHWEGERGNSKWIPDADYVPQKQNKEEQSWGEILNKYDIEDVSFKDGEPDFSDVSKGNVEIEEFTTNRSDNFDQADMKLAEQKGCMPEDVAKWRKENGYTWHECRDMKTMQKVPSKVHNNITHSGGVSEAKKERDAA